MNLLDDLKLQFKQGGVVQKLVFWIIGLYVISLALFYNFTQGVFVFPSWIALSSDPANLLFKPWTIFTYAFFHVGFLHVLFNLMVLNFVSKMFLTFFTQKQFFSLYLSGAIFAGIIFIFSYTFIPSLLNHDVNMVGASGAIMSILIAVATYAPYLEVHLFLIGRVKLWHVALVIVLLDLIQAPLVNTGGHIAHLGGAFFGFIYIKQLQKGIDLTMWLTRL